MTVNRSGRRFGTLTAVAAVAAITVVVSTPAGSAAQTPASTPRQGDLKVLASVISIEQYRPGGPPGDRFAYAIVQVSIPGVPDGTSVEAQLVYPDIPSLPTPSIVEGGAVFVSLAVSPGGTLEEAKAQAARLAGPGRVEVRVSTGGPVLTTTVTSWTQLSPMFLRDVKMRKTKGGATFTGRFVNEMGKPSKQGEAFVVVQQLTPRSDAWLTNPPIKVGNKGTFTVNTTNRPQSGTVGVWGYVVVRQGSGFAYGLGGTYSQPFRYRP